MEIDEGTHYYGDGCDAEHGRQTEPNFEGHSPRECGEHRTVGPHRAWCFEDGEWCYPTIPCRGCELPELRSEVEELRKARPDAATLREHELSDRQIEMLGDVYHQRDTRLPLSDWVAFGRLLQRGYVQEFDGGLGLTPRGVAVLAEHGLVDRE